MASHVCWTLAPVFMLGGNQEKRHAMVGRPVDDGVEDDNIGGTGAGHERLDAVEEIAAIDLTGRGLWLQKMRPRTGFGERERPERTIFHHGAGQVLLLGRTGMVVPGPHPRSAS